MEIADGPDAAYKVQPFAEADVDRREALADGRGAGALQRQAVSLDGLDRFVGEQRLPLFEGSQARLVLIH